MGTWAELLAELNALQPEPAPGVSRFDLLRRKYLAQLSAAGGDRAVILYATKWTGGGGAEDERASAKVALGLVGVHDLHARLS